MSHTAACPVPHRRVSHIAARRTAACPIPSHALRRTAACRMHRISQPKGQLGLLSDQMPKSAPLRAL